MVALAPAFAQARQVFWLCGSTHWDRRHAPKFHRKRRLWSEIGQAAGAGGGERAADAGRTGVGGGESTAGASRGRGVLASLVKF